MTINLKGRSLLTLMDFTPQEIRYLLDLAHDLKAKKKAGITGDLMKGKNIVLMFEKTSTRTRCSFEVACHDEGGHVTYLESSGSQVSIKESLEDTAKVLGRYYDGIEYRGFEQKVVEDLAKYSGVPVWNGLTDIDHPTQILADMLTMEEHMKKPLKGAKIIFSGDIRNNMSYAWMHGCAKVGINYVAYGPDELFVDQKILAKARELANESGSTIEVTSDPACLKGADVIYTDIWASMGEEAQIPDKVKMLSPFKVTMELIEATENPNVLFLHCLPSFHDFETIMASKWKEKGYDIREVTDEVFRSKHSVVFDEAENRMHTIKAVMVATL
ncbi:MAG: ornithine carbamoyltransferase [Eubacteriales bacterium]|nr:ornithine carbamoyltransferase [Eubacteriales bacterium]